MSLKSYLDELLYGICSGYGNNSSVTFSQQAASNQTNTIGAVVTDVAIDGSLTVVTNQNLTLTGIITKNPVGVGTIGTVLAGTTFIS